MPNNLSVCKNISMNVGALLKKWSKEKKKVLPFPISVIVWKVDKNVSMDFQNYIFWKKIPVVARF